MRGVKISENETVRRVSKKGGMDRHTTCPYCGLKVGIDADSKYPSCGHVDKMWDAAGRWYIRFNQFKQVKK